MSDREIWRKVNEEAEEAHRFDKDPREFAMRHLWYPKANDYWSSSALFVFFRQLAK